MSFLARASKNIKKGLYVVCLGKHIFTELDEATERYELYAFPYKLQAQQYLDNFLKGHPFELEFYTIDRLWGYLQPYRLDTDIVIAASDVKGVISFRDYLFPSEHCPIH